MYGAGMYSLGMGQYVPSSFPLRLGGRGLMKGKNKERLAVATEQQEGGTEERKARREGHTHRLKAQRESDRQYLVGDSPPAGTSPGNWQTRSVI